MKVWLVIPHYDYEGYSEPEKAFDSYEKAKTFVAAEPSPRLRNRYEILDMDIE